MVYAGAVPCILIGGDAVSLHVGRIGMATRAGLGDMSRVNAGAGIAGRAETVHTVAVDADRNLGVALREPLAVDAGLVLSELVGAERWIVLPHVGGIGVALAAQGGNVLPRRLAAEAGGLVHGVRVARRIATVTTGARESFLRVDILGELLLCDS